MGSRGKRAAPRQGRTDRRWIGDVPALCGSCAPPGRRIVRIVFHGFVPHPWLPSCAPPARRVGCKKLRCALCRARFFVLVVVVLVDFTRNFEDENEDEDEDEVAQEVLRRWV